MRCYIYELYFNNIDNVNSILQKHFIQNPCNCVHLMYKYKAYMFENELTLTYNVFEHFIYYHLVYMYIHLCTYIKHYSVHSFILVICVMCIVYIKFNI